MGGRPLSQLESLPKNWRSILIDESKQGASQIELRASLGGISDDLWYRLTKDDEEFSRTVDASKTYSQAWWENLARNNLLNNKFNTKLWNINMMNRFNWNKALKNNDESCYKCLVRESKDLCGI